MKGIIRQSLFLWGQSDPETDTLDLAARLKNCQIAVDLFLDGQLPLNDYLDLIESQGVDMDDYAKTTESNLSYFGLV